MVDLLVVSLLVPVGVIAFALAMQHLEHHLDQPLEHPVEQYRPVVDRAAARVPRTPAPAATQMAPAGSWAAEPAGAGQ